MQIRLLYSFSAQSALLVHCFCVLCPLLPSYFVQMFITMNNLHWQMTNQLLFNFDTCFLFESRLKRAWALIIWPKIVRNRPLYRDVKDKWIGVLDHQELNFDVKTVKIPMGDEDKGHWSVFCTLLCCTVSQCVYRRLWSEGGAHCRENNIKEAYTDRTGVKNSCISLYLSI